jgi:predicted GNAT family acetyltransferase
MFSSLSNPIYNALVTADQSRNIGSSEIAFMDIEMSPFIGMGDWNPKSQRKLLAQAPPERTWFLLIEKEVKFIDQLVVSLTLPLCQCICTSLQKPAPPKTEIQLVPLNSSHIDEMIALTTLTKPGPFRKRTIEFGNYHGIFEEGRLVAMGGERLHLDGLTEISAICTHPDSQGRGYGAQIVHFLANDIMNRGLTPFLHARADNAKALDVYKRIGFEMSRKIEFYVFKNVER